MKPSKMQIPSLPNISINKKRNYIINRRCVLMAVYHGDRPSYLSIALQSVLVSEIDRVLIGVDGQISEDLNGILQRMAKSDPRIEVVQFSDSRGLACVLNDLIDVALSDPNCDLLFRMDADDISMPSRFSSQISFLDAHPEVDVLGGNAEIIDGDDVVHGIFRKAPNDSTLKRRLAVDSPFIHPTVAIRSGILRKGHRYPTNTIRFEDVAFWSKLALSGATFANLSTLVLRYRSTVASARRRTGVRKVFNETSIRLNYFFRSTPWRLDILLLIFVIAISKCFMPPRVLVFLHSIRTRLLSPSSNHV